VLCHPILQNAIIPSEQFASMNPRGRLTVTINDLQATAAYRGDYISQALIVYTEIEMIGINKSCIVPLAFLLSTSNYFFKITEYTASVKSIFTGQISF